MSGTEREVYLLRTADGRCYAGCVPDPKALAARHVPLADPGPEAEAEP